MTVLLRQDIEEEHCGSTMETLKVDAVPNCRRDYSGLMSLLAMQVNRTITGQRIKLCKCLSAPFDVARLSI
jgi:hypothetical protein